MLKVPAAAERAFWGLLRACIAAGGHLGRVAEGVADEVRPSPSEPPLPGQRALWVVDAEGLPPRPWRVQPEDPVACAALRCTIPAHVCVARQRASDVQRTQDRHRGEVSEYPSCVTTRCAQGRGIREALDPDARAGAEVAAGARGGFHRHRKLPRKKRAAQEAARARQEASGLLDEVRLLDIHGDPVERDGEEG